VKVTVYEFRSDQQGAEWAAEAPAVRYFRPQSKYKGLPLGVSLDEGLTAVRPARRRAGIYAVLNGRDWAEILVQVDDAAVVWLILGLLGV